MFKIDKWDEMEIEKDWSKRKDILQSGNHIEMNKKSILNDFNMISDF